MLLLIPTQYEAGLLLGEDVARALARAGQADCRLAGHSVRVALCGFGLAAAGAGAAWWLGLPDAPPGGPVVLAGLAGSYDPERLPAGSVVLAGAVACDGIGAGAGAQHQTAAAMGWPRPHDWLPAPDRPDWLTLAGPPAPALAAVHRGAILSVAAASANAAETRLRRERWPEAMAEEMEGYAVALAARLAGRPLTILRAIANPAGVRDPAAWRPLAALDALRGILETWLAAAPAPPEAG